MSLPNIFVALVFLLSNLKFCDIADSNKSSGNGLQIKDAISSAEWTFSQIKESKA